VTASWLIAGTIPAIVYYSMKVMNPRFFILFTFLSSSLVSYMLGTSLGTASTIGVVLIIMAKGGDININLTAGAILSGIYFGDRTSPMSSCANLVANQSETELYPTLKGFRRTTIIPFIISTLIYLMFSFSNPLTVAGNNISIDLENNFTINIIVLLPAIIMLILSSFQFSVRKSMVISIITGALISLVIQGASITELLRTLISGYNLPPSNPLVNLIKGGGLLSMVKTGLAVFVSCSMAGVLEGMDLFNKISTLFRNYNNRAKILLATAITSFVSACYGGNQSIAVVITSQIMKSIYDENKISRKELAVDISNTAVLFAPMIPWNIAVLVPSTTLDVSPARIIPYAFYLFIPFLVNYFNKRIRHNY
jgi:NhaC family Na+:H+ antiporter